jgi:hypothetical protein
LLEALRARNSTYLLVNPGDGGSNSSGVKIEAITWEQNKGGIRISEERAKKEVVIITRSLLDCDFDALLEYDGANLWIILLLI